MKPLMLIPPAQAEALFDTLQGTAPEDAVPGDRFAPQPWLDDPWLDEDTPDGFILFPSDERALNAPASRSLHAA